MKNLATTSIKYMIIQAAEDQFYLLTIIKKNCFIEKNNLGFNCNPDPKDISDHIIKFYKMSHKQRRKMADKSRKYAIKHFNIENLSNNYSKILYFENNSKK